MPLITWSSKYSVGVKNLDEQHQVVVNLLNELHAAMLKGQAQSVAGALLPKIESTKFPGLAEHRAEHRALVAKAEEYGARHKRGDNTMYLELLNFMRDWLTFHMQNVDKKYTVWMNEHGIR
jgi:hemerythrin